MPGEFYEIEYKLHIVRTSATDVKLGRQFANLVQAIKNAGENNYSISLRYAWSVI